LIDMTKKLPVLIAGGGIGGLAVALGLARQGIASRLFERSPTMREVGAGIQLGPNAFRAFDALGIGTEARQLAIYVDSLRLFDAMTARLEAEIPLKEEFRARYGNPYAVIHRGELYRVILQACADSPLVELNAASEVTDYAQDGKTVVVTLADGSEARGCALVGADGIRSRVREKVVGDGEPRVSGHTTYRSVIPVEQMPEHLRMNSATLWAGPKCHLVHYPLSDWKAFNLVVTVHNDAREAIAGKPVSHDEVLEGFAHIHETPRRIIEIGHDWKAWVLCDRQPGSIWQDGRVVLLGDAAHPTLQYLAQGACMALEDAVLLSELMSREDDLEEAMRIYAGARQLRTARIQIQSRAVGEHIYHPEGQHAALRNEIMRRRTPQQWYESLDWIYASTQAA
jgi:2-polyprenyl-6-methoxyphenol hydroxylase-like FAD-dependent oxidoreductase